MRTIKLDVSREDTGVIFIGFSFENEVVEVEFDFSAWAEEYGTTDAGAWLAILPPAGSVAREIALDRRGTTAVWTVTSTDTSQSGRVKAQFTYTTGRKVKKSQVYSFSIRSSLD